MATNSFFNTPQLVNEQTVLDMESENLLSRICEYEYELDRNEKNFMLIKKFFDHNELWPDQCDYAVRVLGTIHTLIRKLNRLLDLFLSYPRETEDNRYTILVKIHYLDKEIGELESQFGHYREICWSNNEDKNSEYSKIAFRLEKTWRDYLSLKQILENIITHSTLPTYTC